MFKIPELWIFTIIYINLGKLLGGLFLHLRDCSHVFGSEVQKYFLLLGNAECVLRSIAEISQNRLPKSLDPTRGEVFELLEEPQFLLSFGDGGRDARLTHFSINFK